MSLKYPALFNPFSIGKCKIKNRIVMSPMHLSGRMNADGTISDSVIEYYVERAKGGVGIIYTGGYTPDIDMEVSPLSKSPFKDPARFMGQTKKLTEKLHAYGTKLFVQIGMPCGRVLFPSAMDPCMNGQPIGPSAIPNRWDPSVICRPVTAEELQKACAKLVEAACIIKAAGADGIDLAGIYGGYFTDQFAVKAFNQRDDEYGYNGKHGEIEFLLDAIKGIKSACGADFPISVRVTPKHYMKAPMQGALPGEDFVEQGRDIEETVELVKEIERAGADVLLIGDGCWDSFYWLYPPMYQKDGLWLEDAAKIRAAVSIPVICPGKINTPEMGNEAIASGKVDAIAIGRAILADPEWANKARTGVDCEIRPCIGCENGCMGRVFTNMPVTCAVNPVLFNEAVDYIKPAVSKKKVVVIGGGVAGMEAARVAALRGHDVSLYEASDALGGAVRIAAVPDFKDADRKLLKWYEQSLKNAGVNINLSSKADAKLVETLNADEIVVATGATPRIPKIDGITADNAITAADVLSGKKVGEQCVVIGGGLVGIETAIWLAKRGIKVTVVEMLPSVLASGEPVPLPNMLMLLDMIAFYKINIITSAKVLSTGNGNVVIEANGEKIVLDADTVILSAGYIANNALYEELNAQMAIPVWNVGDSTVATNVQNAVRDGYYVGNSL